MYSLRDGGQITETIKNAFKYNIIKCYLEVLPENSNGTSTYIHHNNYLKSIDFDDCRYNQEEGIIGTTIAKGLSGDFVNVDSNFNIENREIKLFIGACLNNDLAEDEGKTDIQIINDSNVKYLKMGTFIIQKPENDNVNDNTRFEALDYMIKFNIPFVDRLNYDDPQNPITIGVLLQDICNQAGVTLGTTTFRNSTFVLENNQFTSGETCRDVLKAIAQMAFSWARINENDELVLDFNINSSQGEEIDYNEYYDLKFNNAYGPVNTIVLKDSQIEGENYTIHSSDYIEGTTKPVEIVIQDNPFAYTQDKRQTLIQAGRSLFGFTYDPITINTIGAIYLNCLDKIKPKNMQNAYYSSYIFDTTISYNGKISDEKETKALTEVETKYKFTGDTTKIIRKTQIMVDKANQEITARVETIETESIPNLQAQIDGAIQFWNGENIPTLNNYPANEWTTEALRNNHRADIYTVIQDVQGELKQGKSYRFDKVGNTWQWLELTDNELSAVQALANSKAKVFYTTPTVPYNLGDLWLKDGKLYRCKTAKGASGSYSANDWEEAVEYTDDTVALLAQSTAEAAQSTANEVVEAVNNITNTTGQAEGKYIYLDDSSDDTITSAKFNGETSQATRSGKNILGLTNGTYTNRGITAVVTNGIITLSGTSNDSSYASIIDIPLINPISSSVGTITKSLNPTGTYTGVQTSLRASNAATSVGLWSNNAENKTDTISGNAYYLRIQVNYNVTVNCTLKAQIESGTTVTDFEQYGVMPSPDYPSEIENIEGRNIFDEVLENGGFDTNGINGENAARIRSKNYIPVKENTSYAISVGENTTGKILQVSMSFYDTNDYVTPRISYISWTTLNKSVTFTTPENCKYMRFLISYTDSSAITINDNFNKFMIKKGTDIIPYAPYNSLEVKVVNKNISPINSKTITGTTSNASTIGLIEGTVIVKDIPIQNNKTYYISADFPSQLTDGLTVFLYNGNLAATAHNRTYVEIIQGNRGIQQNKCSEITNSGGYEFMAITTGNITTYSASTSVTINIENLMVTELENAEYEEYKEQTVYFPLAEGQKLYQGSYLADDGIHNIRGQVVFDGSNDEAWSYSNGGVTSPTNKYFTNTSPTTNIAKDNTLIICNRFKKANIWANDVIGIAYEGTATNKSFRIRASQTSLEDWRTWLSNNPVVTEYELNQEEVIPYNTEQQAAWNSIKSLHTYKTVTHIYSDAYAEIGYIKDNGLDIYETKASANVTKNDVAQLKIENGRISSEVSSTQSQLNNYYTKNEADNNTNSTKAELQNIIQQNKTEIEQTIDSITSTVSKKVGNDEIISKINQSAEAIQINAEKISLEGKTIKVLGGTQTKPKFSISDTDYETFNNLNGVAILPNRIWMKNGTKTSFWIVANSSGGANLDMPYDSEISLYEYSGGNTININGKTGNIKCISLTQTSLASEKKNFKKLDNALDIIKNIDIYKYNLKNEKDTDKKHIGFVIGDNYNYSKEVTSIDNEGVDNYSFTSLCCKAIQEQQEEIEELKKEIEKLKGGK